MAASPPDCTCGKSIAPIVGSDQSRGDLHRDGRHVVVLRGVSLELKHRIEDGVAADLRVLRVRRPFVASDYTGRLVDTLTLPLDYSAIERILPHRYPFLLVDRITELETDKRIVGIKNVTLNERYLSHQPGELPALPPTILTEAVAQVGAILILSKPDNREKLIFFMGIDRVRYRRPVYPGDVVEIEARVKRLRSRMGQLEGFARVNGIIVVDGTMTFALGPKTSRGLS